MCSDNTTLKAVEFVSTDERYKAVQKIFDRNLSEAEFLKELERLGALATSAKSNISSGERA